MHRYANIPNMEMQLIKISEVSKILGVSIDTLRRWDKSGKFLSLRKPGGHRYYNLSDVDDYVAKSQIAKSDLFILGSYWASSRNEFEPNQLFYCPNSAIFLSRITKLQNDLVKMNELEKTFPLFVAIAGEIGDNSFAHNLGNWPDIPGIFFGYDLVKKEIVLADRGRGILATLKRARPDLKDDAEALRVAFTEIVSGRTSEGRGNGLKFVRSVVINNDISLYFKTGNAELKIKKGDTDLKILKSNSRIQGCMALIKFK